MNDFKETYEAEVIEVADATESTKGYDLKGSYEISTTDWRE
ncbi:MAG: hypothetical protein QM578_18890 [Pantoea sp.]